MTAPPLRIVILGGDAVGWMTASLMADAWPWATVTVVERAATGMVANGEGSTSQLKRVFDRLGIAEAAWMPRCDATYKVGIEFAGWSDRPGFECYFHPFATELDVHTEVAHAFNARARRQGADVWAHPDRFFLPARLARDGLAPLAPPNLPFHIGYGYHFDPQRLGALLRDDAMKRGVRHLPHGAGDVAVAVADDGTVSHLLLDDGAVVAGDLFVDCGGRRSIIAREALGIEFLPFHENLFNDRVVAISTPSRAGGPACHTRSTALSAGWAWDIPLATRTDNGYVYAGDYVAPEAAEAELRAHLGLGEGDGGARHLELRVGRVERSWSGNCLAVGLAQGDIEPLEATGLHTAQATVEGFIQAFSDGGFTPRHRDAFNATVARRAEGVRDYVVCHYRMNRRVDTAYWRDNAANDRISPSLQAVMHAWFTRADLTAEIARQEIGRYFAPLSWHALLSGHGAFPDDATLKPPTPAQARILMDRIDRFISGIAGNFPTHADALAHRALVAG